MKFCEGIDEPNDAIPELEGIPWYSTELGSTSSEIPGIM